MQAATMTNDQTPRKTKLLAKRVISDYKIIQYDVANERMQSIQYEAASSEDAVSMAQYIILDDACYIAELVCIDGGRPYHIDFIINDNDMTAAAAAIYVNRSIDTMYHKWKEMGGRRSGGKLSFNRTGLVEYMRKRDCNTLKSKYGMKFILLIQTNKKNV